MANQKITIEIDGKDNASSTFKKVGLSITDLNSAMTIASRVYDTAAQAFKMTVSEAQAYDQQIRDVMLSTGATAEESSRLVQVVDDAGVSYGTLKTAMKMASKDGIEPNIASLQMLSDQYLKLAPGVERNQFLLDKFGKSGLEMARVMELGGDALGKMNDEIDGGLVLTQKAIDQSEEYRKNVDALNDAWQSYKVTLGNSFIPVLNDVMEGMINQNEIRERANELIKEGIANNREEALSMAALEIKIQDYTEGLDSAGLSYRAMAESAYVASESVAAFSMSYEKQLDLIADFTKSLEDQSQKLDEIKEKYGEGSQEYADATAQFETDSRRRILAMLEEQLSLDGLSQQEQEILLQKGLAWGVYSQQAVDASRAAMAEVAALTEAINTIPSERTFTMSVLVQGADAVGGLGAGFGASQWEGRAAGGSVSAGTTYMVGERGPELFTPQSNGNITPNNKLGGIDTEKIISALERFRLNEDRLAQLIDNAIQRNQR